jgi:hypothetical protein
MIIFQEAAQLPQLSQSSLFVKFNEQSNLGQIAREAAMNKANYMTPETMKEIMSLIKLNGSPNAKKAVKMFEDGRMKIIFDKDRSKVPQVLPYLISRDKSGNATAFVYADKVVTNITSSAEYTNLMATMEAAYLAAALVENPNQFLLNRQLILNLCGLYQYLWLMPLEQKLYIKGDNLTKAQMYVISYFYRMIDGDKMSPQTIPFNRLLKDRVFQDQIKQITMEVATMPSLGIGNLISLIKQINPVRYKDLDSTFMTYFASSCGIPLVFALENLQYLFLLVTSAYYKTKLTSYSLNKSCSDSAKKCLTTLNGMNISV